MRFLFDHFDGLKLILLMQLPKPDLDHLKKLNQQIFQGEITMKQAAQSVKFTLPNGDFFYKNVHPNSLHSYFAKNQLTVFRRGRKGFDHPIDPTFIGFVVTKYEEYFWGVNTMWQYCLSCGLNISHDDVYEIYKSNIIDFRYKQQKPKRDRVRYVATHTNAIWHADLHELHFFGEVRYLYVLIDDCSRYIVGFSIHLDKTPSPCTTTMQNSIREYGKPAAYFADNGGENVGLVMKLFLHQNNIDLINTIPGNPQQNGKIEKWWQPLDKYLNRKKLMINNWEDVYINIQKYVVQYNELKPHNSLPLRERNGKKFHSTPKDIYRNEELKYNEGDDITTVRVLINKNGNGDLIRSCPLNEFNYKRKK